MEGEEDVGAAGDFDVLGEEVLVLVPHALHLGPPAGDEAAGRGGFSLPAGVGQGLEGGGGDL